jgi:hypothetical protein
MPHDYIVQLIQQFAELVARLGGLRDEKRYDEAEQAIGDALRAAFGPLCGTLEEVTPESVVSLADEDKIRLYCALLREAASIAEARGNARRATVLGARAEAIERMSGIDDERPPHVAPGSAGA